MDIPRSFPPQELAKLVLGYLAEEELMTAYDEFLQASPYLDAYKNEYDRILMTSLRSILADYRAVKIYVESCKPHPLRKKLLQCYNLLEMVKYLITVVDIQKLPIQDNVDRYSLTKNNVTTRISCDVCVTMNLKTCVCQNKSIVAGSQLLSTEDDKHILPRALDIAAAESQHLSTEEDKHTLPRFLEATSLADLPGNALISKKVPGREIKNNNLEQSQWCTLTSNNNIIDITHKNVCVQLNPNQSNQTQKAVLDSRKKIEEFNTILNLVCNKNVSNEKLCDNLVSNRVSSVTTIQDFTSGVQGTNHDRIMRVPDSSTADTVFIPILTKPKEAIITAQTKHTPKPNINHPYDKQQKCENKIKILSDVRFDRGISYETPPAVLKSTATSSSVVPNTKRILINGTPGFTQKSDMKTCNYSQDEIMAMPTLIILPKSGSTYNLIATSSDSKVDTCKINTTTTSTLSKCKPLFVDVTSSMPSLTVTDIFNKDVGEGSNTANEVGLVKTVDHVAHTSLPKNSTISNKSTTPQVLPPIRKSSSTPRRNSHIRILDFSTPRRILDKAINEKDSSDDVVVINSSIETTPRSDSNVVNDLNTNEETMKIIKKKNWDEELRVIAVTNPDLSPPSIPKITKNKKKENKKISTDREKCDKSMKVKKSRKKKQFKDIEETQSIPKKDVPIKAIIKIISAEESECHSETENYQCINKQNEDVFDTPENERLSLQNEIGVKFDIADLLETPYKQAIYDIQMETPRFLGPDLPGEPLSDIKITNIPTPKFFDTPKPPQATSSSYSSRPTDYSSGGSYYKPDDQDCPYPDVSVSKNNEYSKTHELIPIDSKKEISEPKCSPKSRRPIRECAKNVSYFNSSIVKKSSKDNDVSSDEVKTVTVKSQTTDTKKSVSRRPSKSKITKSEKHKSPFKRDVTKNFMKIKPRRVTPIKDTKKRKTLSDLRLVAKKKTTIKDNNFKISSLPVAPSKSRRKSSTPRKLHCGKMFNSSTSSSTSPNTPGTMTNKASDVCTSLDNCVSIKPFYKDRGEASETPTKEGEDSISKIKEFIESMSDKKITTSDEYVNTKSFHNNLVKRGLDIESARIIERDLLDTPPLQDGAVQSTSNDIVEENTIEKVSHDCLKPDFNANKQNTHNSHESDEEVEDIEFSVKECNEDTNNFFACSFDESTFIPKNLISLKDKFCMEVCIDDGVILRLKATDFNVLFNEEPMTLYDKNEIDAAVTSISNIDTLYTPMKDRRAQYYDIFDSTLTSIDTPLKANSSKRKEHEESVAEIVIDVENITTKKRKRVQSNQDESLSTKKTKVEPPYLLNHANIQNIDIESVLSKLHGP